MTTSTVSASPTVLVVDDEEMMRELARAVLETGGITVIDEACDGHQALEHYARLNPPPVPSVVLLDQRMPGLTGLEVAEQILARNPGQVIILFSAFLDAGVEAAAQSLGVTACVSKTDVARIPDLIRRLTTA